MFACYAGPDIAELVLGGLFRFFIAAKNWSVGSKKVFVL
jgi:hypothetical protein